MRMNKSKCYFKLIICCFLLITVFSSCAKSQNVNTSIESSSHNMPNGTLSGIVYDASTNLISVINDEKSIYNFNKNENTNIKTENGILIGDPIIVEYKGILDEALEIQNVEIISITVSDLNEISSSKSISSNPPKQTIQNENTLTDILASMTLNEKIGQMFIARCPAEAKIQSIKDYHLGGYILFARDFKDKTKKQVANNIISYQDAAKVNMLIAVDEEGGIVNRISTYKAFRPTPFSSPQTLFSKGGLELILSDSHEKSQLLKSLGINVNMAPVCDVSENSTDYIYKRSFGKNANETSKYVETVVNAMTEDKIGTVLKHFPGYGNNEDTHIGIAYDKRSYDSFVQNDFKPFKAGIKANADCILVSHNIVESIDKASPASLSEKMHIMLRNKLGFTGVIMTDDLAMDAIKDYSNGAEAAVTAVMAGNDLLCCTDFEIQIPAVIKAVQEGTISENQIDISVMRILKWKSNLEILD